MQLDFLTPRVERLSHDGAIDVEDATLTSQILEAKASGRIDPKAESDFSLHAQSIGQPARTGVRRT